MAKSALEQLDNVTAIQCSDGNWNYDAYMQGMANGLILAQAIMKGEDPVYLDAPKQWLCDKLTHHNEPSRSPDLRIVAGGDAKKCIEACAEALRDIANYPNRGDLWTDGDVDCIRERARVALGVVSDNPNAD